MNVYHVVGVSLGATPKWFTQTKYRSWNQNLNPHAPCLNSPNPVYVESHKYSAHPFPIAAFGIAESGRSRRKDA